MSDIILLTVRFLCVISCIAIVITYLYSALDLHWRGGDWTDNAALSMLFLAYIPMVAWYSDMQQRGEVEMDNGYLLFIRILWLALFVVLTNKEIKVIKKREYTPVYLHDG